MTASARADKLFPALSAKERALVILRAWKEGGDVDPQVRQTMPDRQVDEFNGYIELMNAVNEKLGPWVLLLRANVEQLGLISGWLATVKLWSLGVFSLSCFIFGVPEPITEGEHGKLKKGKRQPRPNRALRYEVLPNARAKEVEASRQERARIWDVIKQAPHLGEVEGSDKPRIDEAYDALLDRLSRQVPEYWCELRGVEILLHEAKEGFGEDAALPEVRAIVEWLRRELADLHEILKNQYLRDIDLSEPNGEHMANLRKIAHWPEGIGGAVSNITDRPWAT